jgi:hypothetical protein
MFRVTPSGPNRVDIEFSGKLDEDEMEAALDELEAKTKGIEHGRMLYRVGDFKLPTLGAIRIEFSRLPSMFSLIRNFDRAAVIADKQWLRTVSEIEGALIPGLKIKGFEPGEEAAAEAWLAEDER